MNLLDLGNRLKSFLQQNPSPASFVGKSIASPIQQGFNQIGQSVGNTIRGPISPLPNQGIQKITQPIRQFSGNLFQDYIQRLPGKVGSAVNLSPFGQFAQRAQGKTPTVQQQLGDIGNTGSLALDVATLPFGGGVVKNAAVQLGKQGLKMAVKEGVVSGVKFGAAYGGLESLFTGKDEQDIKKYLIDITKSTAVGAGVGGVAGGALGGAGYSVGKVLGKIKSLITRTPDVEKQLRNLRGQWVEGNKPIKPKGMAKASWEFQLKFNKQYGRNPYTPVYSDDLQKAIKIEAEKRIGNQVRPIQSDMIPEKPSSGGEIPKGVGGVKKVQTIPSIRGEPQVQAPATIKTPVPELSAQKPLVSGGSSLPPSIPPASIDPIQKVIAALKEAKPLEQKQGQIYAKIRSQQAGAIAGIGQNIPGEAGFHAQLGQLKGQMPKVTFESIRKQIDQPTIDSLFNKIEQSNITPFEKITAKSGLSKLFGAEGGTVPVKSELSLLNNIFPPELIQAIQDKRSFTQKLFANVEDALNIPRSIMATADMSAPLRQGAFLIGRPKQWIPAFRDMFKYALSPKAYQGLADDIAKRPTYQLMRENRLAITDAGAILGNREETFMSNIVDKIPGLGIVTKASNRAYSGFLNKLRADVFDDLVRGAKQQGLDIKTVAPDIAKFVNSATGRGDLGMFQRAATILNGVMFSPRLLASRLNLMRPDYYASLNPYVRKEALKSLVTFAGTAMSVLTLAKLSGAEVGVDPRSADFGKIKLGNTRYDILAGFQQPMRLTAQLITGKLISTTTGKEFTLGEGYKPLTRLGIVANFLKSKESPVVGFIAGLLEGSNAIGQPFDVPTELVSRFIPMVAQDMYDLAKEKGSALEGIIGAAPAAFGVGVQTYGSQVPSLETSKAGNTTVKLKPVGGLAEDIMAKIKGIQPSNIPQTQWAGITQAEQQKKQDAVLKDKIKQQAEAGNLQPQGNFIPVVLDGKVSVIDTSFQPTPPELTGMEELDKKAISKFNGEITQKANDIYDLYKAGKLTQDEANTQLLELKNLKAKLGAGKKPAKITLKKLTIPKIKLTATRKSRIQNIKIAAAPKPKKIAIKKAQKIKPIKIAKLKGLTKAKALA